ncbi:uncharacterized protein CCOS01_08018 [Colletotrichum costaricense]|uniref:Uncharacterized protein n=1 Tax=Colletotrichum costaricense TaxID=1209916 RepID=A0AAI9YY15_9PEZI|nr:uncharacterized protein CCOS01_08018 [Colletotrichum costaricense]KAK1527756.1 hypothetical protein CCOS01_08018 [Colletotrichum costaricense]
MGRDLCLRLSLCSCLRVAVKEVDRPSNTEKYLTKPKLSGSRQSRFAPRDPEDAMCGEMRKVGSALLKEETEDRLPRLPLGLGPVEVVASIRWTRQECSCKARYAAREVWEARRTRYWVGQDKQPMQVTVVGMLGDGELNNTNETTGLSWVSDDAEDVADAANEKLKPRLAGLNRRRADATDETTVE